MTPLHSQYTRFSPNALGSLPTQSADDRDHAIEIVRRKFTDHKLVPSESAVNLQFRSGGLESLALHLVGYNAPVTIDADPLSRLYLICFPVRGSATVEIEGREWHSDTTHAAVLTPNTKFALRWHDPSPQVVLSIPRERVREVAGEIYGVTTLAPSALSPTIDLTSSAGRSLLSSLTALHEDLNSGAAAAFPRLLRKNIEEGIIARVLGAAAVTVSSDALQRGNTGKIVNAFLDLADSAASEGLSASAAAARLGVPLRTLQEHTQNELQATPGEVLMRGRLQLARLTLQLADPATTTVTAVAYQCGFRHTGRFAQVYRQAFGERPSDTLFGRAR